MKVRFSLAILLAAALCASVGAQDQNSPQDQNSAPSAGQSGGGYGRRGGRGFGGGGMMGRAVSGNVTAVASGNFIVKTFAGDTYTVNFGDNTRFMKMQGGMGGGRGRLGGGGGAGGGGGMRGNPPEQIKAADIKVGDPIMARGEIDSSAKSVGAVAVMLLDPQMAQRMQQMAADYGKTWLMGRVTAVDGTNVTLMGTEDNAPHTFVANENTEFRERRNPITLADVKVGDMVRVQGALNSGTFTASEVNVMRMPQGGPNGPGGPGGAQGGPNQ
jgi:hypothetical protein